MFSCTAQICAALFRCSWVPLILNATTTYLANAGVYAGVDAATKTHGAPVLCGLILQDLKNYASSKFCTFQRVGQLMGINGFLKMLHTGMRKKCAYLEKPLWCE